VTAKHREDLRGFHPPGAAAGAGAQVDSVEPDWGEAGVEPWQIRHAGEAVRIYRHQYRASRLDPVDGAGSNAAGPSQTATAADRVQRLREVMRIRHDANSAESGYAEWVRRFLAYREGVGEEGGPTPADARAFLTRLVRERAEEEGGQA
jgi:hypothetical protein